MTIVFIVMAAILAFAFILSMVDSYADPLLSFILFVLAVICGLLAMASSKTEDANYVSRTKIDAMIELCEADLPRAQHCTLIAVPAKPRP